MGCAPELSVAVGSIQVTTLVAVPNPTMYVEDCGQPNITGATESTSTTTKVHGEIYKSKHFKMQPTCFSYLKTCLS